MNKKIFALLAIFLLLASVSVIYAEDNATDDTQDGTADTDTTTDDTAADDETTDDTAADEEEDPVGDNPYRHGALTPNEKAFLEDAPHAAGGEEKTVSASGSPTTGNPILVLLAAMAILGAVPLSRRK